MDNCLVACTDRKRVFFLISPFHLRPLPLLITTITCIVASVRTAICLHLQRADETSIDSRTPCLATAVECDYQSTTSRFPLQEYTTNKSEVTYLKITYLSFSTKFNAIACVQELNMIPRLTRPSTASQKAASLSI